ncbi:MAG: STAS domain-containing protein [Candidatus Eremiobacteraeota bacterium]|nr:STAS domain-containing protein [Candidatus Eremiobacteraeota bacterium]
MEVRESPPVAFVDPSSTFVVEELAVADVVHVFGEFSYETSAAIEEGLVRCVRIGRSVRCDLRECTYMDAAGAGVLARARRSLGSAFTIVAPQRGIVRRVLDVTGLSRFE